MSCGDLVWEGLTSRDHDGRRGDGWRVVIRGGLLRAGRDIELPLVCERRSIAVVADCNDQEVTRGDLVLENGTGGEFRGVVRHCWHRAAVVLVTSILVNQHDTCGIILAAYEAGHEREAVVQVGVDEVVAAVLEVQAVCVAPLDLPLGDGWLIEWVAIYLVILVILPLDEFFPCDSIASFHYSTQPVVISCERRPRHVD